MLKLTRVVGDFDGRKDISKLSVAAVKAMPKNDRKIFLGDSITSITKNAISNEDDGCFEYSTTVLVELFKILGIQICQRYNDIPMERLYETFRNDLMTIMNDHFLDAFETPLDDTDKDKHRYCHMKRSVEYIDISRQTYSFQPDLDVVWIYGNKEHQTMTNFIHPIDTHVEGNEIVIRSGVWKSNSTSDGINIYRIDRQLANLLYTYFHLCRVAYMDNGILYIHYGGVGSQGNDRNITLNNQPLNISKTITGHEKMCCVLEGRGIRSYYFDLTGFYTAYDRQSQRLHPNEMYLTVEGNVVSYPLAMFVARYFLMTRKFYKSKTESTYIRLTRDDVHDCNVHVRSSYYLSPDEPNKSQLMIQSTNPPSDDIIKPERRMAHSFDSFIMLSRNK